MAEEMPSSIIQEFILALEQEIDAIKRGKGGSIVKVFNGRFLREVSSLFVYVFHLENFLAVLDDSPAEIRIGGNTFQAQLLSSQGLEVEIGIERSCGQFIPEAWLQTNLWYLLELLRKKFGEYQNGSATIDFHLSEVLFSNSKAEPTPFTDIVECGNCGTKNRIKQYEPGLIAICGKCKAPIGSRFEAVFRSSAEPPNEAQKQAIEASFFSQLSVIWGPPGTGKTKTIAQAIDAHLQAGRRVLLVSGFNPAFTDTLLRLIMGQEGCHGTTAEVFSRVQA